jgi:predicted nucleotidyltransferase
MNARARASGRFVLRAGSGLHGALRAAAREQGLSLNEYCVRRLAAPGPAIALPAAEAAVRWATGALGRNVVGVVLFGSWARDEATAGSDVDLLVVLDEQAPLTRQLYRLPGASDLVWGERPLEPQFAHLPPVGEIAGGLWAEVALDGLVLFERELRLSRRLARIRRDIAEGRLVRRTAHGQPYWTPGEAA